MNTNEKVAEVIELLKNTDIEGCITGSSMLGGSVDFDMWDSTPDVDVFVYREGQLAYAADLLTLSLGFKPATEGEAWKLGRIRTHGVQRKASLSTLKLVHPNGITANITWKRDKANMLAVLASFDMSIIMMGYDIESKMLLDLRRGDACFVLEDPEGKWSPDVMTAYPNPLRKQDADIYGTEMWVRQFNRVIKYWERGFDTRPMARFYIRLIEGVLAKGALFASKASTERFNLFRETYEPIRDSMVEWLEDKEER